MVNKCKKYGLAITNYVLEEKMDVPREELFNHLRACKKCRAELFDWQNNIAVLRAEEYHARPEVKKKTEALIRELKKELIKPIPEARRPKPKGVGPKGVGPVKLAPGENLLDHKEHIGSAAGVVWHYLGKYGKTSLTALPKKTKLSPLNAYEAVGWLALEKKIYRSYVKPTTYGWLTEHEQTIYQQRQARV